MWETPNCCRGDYNQLMEFGCDWKVGLTILLTVVSKVAKLDYIHLWVVWHFALCKTVFISHIGINAIQLWVFRFQNLDYLYDNFFWFCFSSQLWLHHNCNWVCLNDYFNFSYKRWWCGCHKLTIFCNHNAMSMSI